ncbi:unnamed protein product [Larinioides sclopetarius]|uniref:CCHC-type domain-containing protein n=1 Tax=Larinioides sclopetarius TaxID=280406 RepID=A0AAV2B9T0_9ARAC
MGKPRLDPRAKTTGNSLRPVHTSINKYKGNKINQNSNFKKESEPRGFSKKFETNVDKRKRLQCFECGSYEHLRPQCPQIRVPKSEVNRVGKEGDRNLLDPYIKIGKINGYSMPILRDTGATVDVICQKYVNSNRMTGEHVWVKHIFDDHMTCLPVAQIDVEYGLGRVTTKAVVVEDKLDQGRYILGNQTADLLKTIDKSKNLNFASVNAVVTRSKTEQLRNDTNSLDEQINTEICEERIMEESEDEEKEEVLPKADLCMDEVLITIAPIAIFICILACCIYCCCKCCQCCRDCCCKDQTPGAIIIDATATQPLSPPIQHAPPPSDAQTLLAHQQMSPPPSYYPPQSPPPQYPLGPIPYPPNATQPPMSYYPQQPLPQLPPMGGQPPYPVVNYNPLVPPHCPLPPIPQQTETGDRQPEYNPSYVPSAPPP